MLSEMVIFTALVFLAIGGFLLLTLETAHVGGVPRSRAEDEQLWCLEHIKNS